ncbi:MAG TPA: hypothetical protein VHD83_06155 [Puia sp.]|nr:hypothetical protein [Puia sp.]
MSVNLLPQYRVIAIAAVVSIAFSALAWSGDNRLRPPSIQVADSVPVRTRPVKKAPKPKQRVEEGRMARELDLRMDVNDMEGIPEMPEPGALGDLDAPIDLDALKGLNAQVEADVLKNMDAWNNLDALKELDLSGRMDWDALDELKDINIEEEDLDALKDLNIDEDIWNELRDLKQRMDDLREELEQDRANGINDYRLHREAEAIMEAVQAEIPRVRKEVQKAMQEYSDSRRRWQ